MRATGRTTNVKVDCRFTLATRQWHLRKDSRLHCAQTHVSPPQTPPNKTVNSPTTRRLIPCFRQIPSPQPRPSLPPGRPAESEFLGRRKRAGKGSLASAREVLAFRHIEDGRVEAQLVVREANASAFRPPVRARRIITRSVSEATCVLLHGTSWPMPLGPRGSSSEASRRRKQRHGRDSSGNSRHGDASRGVGTFPRSAAGGSSGTPYAIGRIK